MKNNTNNEEEILMQFERQWDKAIVANDATEIGLFMSDDWVIVGTEGGITSRDAFLNAVSSGDLFHDRMDFEDLRVKIYGDTGVVTSKGTSGGTYKGKPFSYYEWATSVYIREGDQWFCRLTMLTPAKSA